MSQSIGGVLFGFEQQVWRNVPPPEEVVHHARPDGPVAASDGSTYEIRMPEPGEAGAEPADAADAEESTAEPTDAAESSSPGEDGAP